MAEESTLGLYPKFSVQKNSDPEHKHDNCSYFVLDLTHDPAARVAAETYSELIRPANPTLANELIRMTREIREGRSR